MYVWLNLKTIKFYLIKLAANYYWQPSYLLGKRASWIKKKQLKQIKQLIEKMMEKILKN